MNIHPLTPTYAVSPQIKPSDIPAIRDAGYSRIICNRPDAENPADLQSDEIRRAAEDAGLEFIFNPVIGGAITMENVDAQGAAIASASGPVFAYCASGNRSTLVWGLSQAGFVPTGTLVEAATGQGYNLGPVLDAIETLAAERDASKG